MIRRLIALCGVLTLLFTLGCGNKGSLYLPEPDAAPPADAQPDDPGQQ